MIPRHYDVEAIRETGRRSSDRLMAEAMSHATSEKSRQFITAQSKLGMLLTELTALQAEALNEGVPVDVLAGACGAVIGQMVRSGQLTYEAQPELVIKFVSYLNKGITGCADELTVGGETMVFSPIPGGHA